jgi:ABC-type uncharacterized transport system involved in gliding motility auxiliary subunit
MPKRKNTVARYAIIGLVLASIACIATGLIAVVQGATALKIFTPTEAQSITLDAALYISIVLLVVGLAAYAILSPNTVRRFLTGRQARYGSNALILSLAFLGIIVVVNLLAIQNPCPFQTCDVTEDQQNTLAPETLQALATLPDKVTAIAFYSTQTPADTAKQLLTNFKSHSKGKFDFRFVDPNADPVSARQYGVTGDGKIVLTMGKSVETASFADETELDRALIRLISPQQRTVYFLTGHGEPDINGTDNNALTRARQTLESKNYTVKSLNLAATNKVPDDAKAIIVAGPKNPLLDQEVSLLQAYVNKGGSLIAMEDPTPFTNVGTNPDPLADYLKNDWGITLDNDVVIDTTSNQPLLAISASYSATHAITQHMTTVTIMPQSRSLELSSTPPQGVSLTALVMTAQQSWGETNFDSLKGNQQIGFDRATDLAGPLNLAASGENSNAKGRVVAFGNSIFATDKGFDAYANGDIFVNSVDWAAQEENLLQITPRQPITRTFKPPSQLQFVMILLTSVIVIPGLVVVFGISAWVARRRRG